jgi:hypothetical protein
MFLRNVVIKPVDYTVYQRRRQLSEHTRRHENFKSYKSSFYGNLSFGTPNTRQSAAVRSEAWVLAGWLLRSWVRIPLKAWMFVPSLSVLCCPV